jgi:DNA-binding transcriptional LysR family regulator
MNRHFDDVMLGSIELFCLAAELESFTAAATQLGISPAAVSRAVGRLEQRLNVRLFIRSTRKIRLTDGGRAYFEQCKRALGQLVEAERELTGAQLEPAGVVRMSVPTPIAEHCLLPLLPAFRARYPKVRLDVQITNRNVDFTAEGYDLAVRARIQPDSGLVARKLMDAELVLVASPQYLERAGVPLRLEDLARHECIQFVLPSSGQRVPWSFRSSGAEIEIETEGGYSCSEELLGTATLARAGAGIVQIYRFIVEEDLRRGTLVELLRRYGGRARPFSLIYPGARHMPLRVRVLIDYLVQAMT